MITITFEADLDFANPAAPGLVIPPAVMKTMLKLLTRPALAMLVGEAMLNANRVAEPVATGPERLLDAAELANHLGVAKSRIMTAARRGEIPMTRVGRYYRFNPTAVTLALRR